MSKARAIVGRLVRAVKNYGRPHRAAGATMEIAPPEAEIAPKIDALTADLAAKYTERIAQLAKFRGQSFQATLKHVVNYVGLRNVPQVLKTFMLPREHAFRSLKAEGTHHATITLKNGRILTGYRSSARMQRYYHCLFDLLPADVTAETYEVYVESYRRYAQGIAGIVERYLPPQGTGGVLVDAGAYIGFKAIRYADYVGPAGRSIMIELGADNELLARRNIEQNNLLSRVQSFCYGVWSSDGEHADRWRDRSTHTLAETDEHDYCTTNLTVTTRTLDSIFAEAGADRVDVLNLQLNGAEPEAIDGLVDYFDKVRVIRAAASFHHKGTSKKSILVAKLKERGCWVDESKATSVLAVTPAYRNMFHV